MFNMKNDDKQIKPYFPGVYLPAEIMFHPFLTNFEKMLFGVISNLSKNPSGCWATNQFFVNLFGVQPQSVSRSIGNLAKHKFIRIEHGTEVASGFRYYRQRRIFVNHDYHKLYEKFTMELNAAFFDGDAQALSNHQNNKAQWDLSRASTEDTENIDKKESLTPPVQPINTCVNRHSHPCYTDIYKLSTTINDLSVSNETELSRSDNPLPLSHQTEEQILTKDKELLLKGSAEPQRTRRIKEIVQSEQPKPPTDNQWELMAGEVIKYWETKFGKMNNPTRKKSSVSIKALLKGKFFSNIADFINTEYDRAYTLEEIKQAIDHFALSAFSMEHYPEDIERKKKFRQTKLPKFFYNKYLTGPKIDNIKSIFIINLRPPKSLPKAGEAIDDYPKVTDLIRRQYVEIVCGGVNSKFNARSENCFKTSAKKLMEFFDENKKKIIFYEEDRPFLRVKLMFSALEAAVDGDWSKITPGWLSTDINFSIRLPQYLNNQALVRCSNIPLQNTSKSAIFEAQP